MAFRLTGEQKAKKAEHIRELRKKANEVKEAIHSLNSAIQEGCSEVEAARQEYNSALADAESWCEEIAEENQTKWDNRPEEWQESDVGREVSGWIDEWRDFSPYELKVDEPPMMDVPDIKDGVDALESLANEPE